MERERERSERRLIQTDTASRRRKGGRAGLHGTKLLLTTTYNNIVMPKLLWFSLACLSCCKTTTVLAQQQQTTVFVHGEGGWPCIRIPAITRCGGTLHAFAECRTRIGDGCVPSTKPPATKSKSHTNRLQIDLRRF